MMMMMIMITYIYNIWYTVLIDREQKTACNRYSSSLDPNLPKTVAERITKYENLALQIKNIWKLNIVSIYPLGYLRCASNQQAREFPAHSLERKHVGKSICPVWKHVVSKHVKQILWQAAVIKLVCSLLPGCLCGRWRWGVLLSSLENRL